MDDNTLNQFRRRLAQINGINIKQIDEAHQTYVVRYGEGGPVANKHEIEVKAKNKKHAGELAHKKAKEKGHTPIEIYSAETSKAHKERIESDKNEEIRKNEHHTNVVRAYLNARAKDKNPLDDDAHVRACKAAAKAHPINAYGNKTHPYHVHMILDDMKSDTEPGHTSTMW
jgi:ribosomal protein L25 (general stress protein Ctc)